MRHMFICFYLQSTYLNDLLCNSFLDHGRHVTNLLAVHGSASIGTVLFWCAAVKKTLNPESLPCYKLPCQNTGSAAKCEGFWSVCVFVLNLENEVKVVVWASAVSIGFVDAVYVGKLCSDVCCLFTVWWRKWLSTWLTCWKTVETKSRRICWPMEVWREINDKSPQI